VTPSDRAAGLARMEPAGARSRLNNCLLLSRRVSGGIECGAPAPPVYSSGGGASVLPRQQVNNRFADAVHRLPSKES